MARSSQQTKEEVLSIKPKSVYGIRMDVDGLAFYNPLDEIIYPVEGVLALRDNSKGSFRFLRFPWGIHPVYLTLSINRKWLAIIEASEEEYHICLYDAVTLKKRRTLPLPEGVKKNGVRQFKFNHDGRAVAIMTQGPEEIIYLMYFDKDATVLELLLNSVSRPMYEFCAFSPFDRNTIGFCGEKFVQVVTRAEKSLSLTSTIKVNFVCSSMVFLSNDLILVGTKTNELFLIDGGEYKYKQPAADAHALDILWDQEALNKEREELIPLFPDLPEKAVIRLRTYSKGFSFAVHNKLFIFDKVSKFRYERRTILTIPTGVLSPNHYQITHYALNGKEDKVVLVAKHAQIYIGPYHINDQSKTHFIDCTTVGIYWHTDEIVSVSICAWKPIIITASRDQTVRVWNYVTEQVEMIRKFQVEVHLVELNPTGLMAAIGFTDQLRITQLLLDDLNIVKTYNFSHCLCVKYSNYGHLMAAAYDNKIAVTSVYSLDIISTLQGHNGTVLSVYWSKGDKFLFSGGADGAIYQWDVINGQRIQEVVLKGTEYTSLCCSQDENPTVFASTQFGTIREFINCELVRDIQIPTKTKTRLTDLALMRSDLLMFISTQSGELLSVEVPIMEGSNAFTPFRFFVSTINKMVLSYDGTLLICITKMGTLAILCLENISSKLIPIDCDLLKCSEVLIPRHALVEKNEQIQNLTLRLKQQAAEFEYQISQTSMFDSEQLANVHRSYCLALQELRNKNNEIEQAHTEELNNITLTIKDMKDEHQRLLETLTNQYSERMLIEYQKYTKLRDSMLELQDNYESRLKKSAGDLQDTVEGLESDYKRQLDERNVLIRELMKEMQDRKVEFIEYCRGVEAEYNHSIDELNLQYENKLTSQRNDTKLWRGKCGVLQKRYDTLQEELEKYLDEADILKEEQQKSNANLGKAMRLIEELTKEIADRDYAISLKEKRIQEHLHKNQELDKYKLVLAHKISELKAQIEPIEFDINDKRKRIAELEVELSAINANNVARETQLNELKDKYLNNIKELQAERQHAKTARACIEVLYSDIYNVTGKIHLGNELRDAIEVLFEKHANDDELKRFISTDELVRDEFMRQRAYIEDYVKKQQKKIASNPLIGKYKKLFAENNDIMKEIERISAENDRLRACLK